MDNLFNLTGKRALITGSTKGIGKAIAHRMAQHGAKVIISSRKEPACQETANGINKETPNTAFPIPCNISNKDELENLVSQANNAMGGIDILVCNAAINPYFGPSSKLPDDIFAKVLHTNIIANHQLAHMVLPQMTKRKDGIITVISSIGGLRGTPILGSYAISKAADLQLVRNLAVEYGEHNIRINAIAPGLVRTHFARALWEDPEILAETTKGTPLRRIGEPDEIAGAAVFLASPAGSFMTGQTIVIDGGGVA